MDQPPQTGDPYTLLAANAPNLGAQGVVVAWDAVRFFWGGEAQQGWFDLQNIQAIGSELV